MPLFYQELDIDSESLLLRFQDGAVNLIMASVNVTIGPSGIKVRVYRRMPKEGKGYYSTFPKWFVLTLQYSNQSKRQIINFGHNTKYEFQFQKSDSDENPSIHCTLSHVPDSCCLQRSDHQICYIISILHPLFHLKKFRDLILSATPSKSMFLQGVRQLFSKMLICDTLTPIKCFTDSLGWPPIGLNQPHDAVDFANKFLNMIFSVIDSTQKEEFNKIFQMKKSDSSLSTYIWNITSNCKCYSQMLKSQNLIFEQIPEVLIISFALDQNQKSAFDLNSLLSLVKDNEIHNYVMAHIGTISKSSKVNHYTTFCRTSKENVWVHFDEKPTLIYNECEHFDNDPIQLVKNAISNQRLQPVMIVYVKESEIDGYLNPVDFYYPTPDSRPVKSDESQSPSMTKLTCQNIIKSIIPETNELFLSMEGDLSADDIYQRIKDVMKHDGKQFEHILLSKFRAVIQTNATVLNNNSDQVVCKKPLPPFLLQMRSLRYFSDPFFIFQIKFDQDLYIKSMNQKYNQVGQTVGNPAKSMFELVKISPPEQAIEDVRNAINEQFPANQVFFYHPILDENNVIVDYQRIESPISENTFLKKGFIFIQEQNEQFILDERTINQSQLSLQLDEDTVNPDQMVLNSLYFFIFHSQVLQQNFVVDFRMIFHMTHFSMPITFCQISEQNAKTMRVPYNLKIQFDLYQNIIRRFMNEQNQSSEMMMYVAIKKDRPLFPFIKNSNQMLNALPKYLKKKYDDLTDAENNREIYTYYSFRDLKDKNEWSRFYFSENSQKVKYISTHMYEKNTKVSDLVDLLPIIFKKPPDDTANLENETEETVDQTKNLGESSNTTNESSKDTKESTEKANESTDKTNESTEKANESTDKTNESTDKTNESTEKAKEATDKTNEATDKANESTDKTNESTKDTKESTDKAKEATEKANESTDKTKEESRLTCSEYRSNDDSKFDLFTELNPSKDDDDQFQLKFDYITLLSNSRFSNEDKLNFFKIKFDPDHHFTDYYTVVSFSNNHFQCHDNDESTFLNSDEIRVDRKSDNITEYVNCCYGVRYNETKYIYLIGNPFILGLTSVEYEDNMNLTIDQFSRFQEAVDYEEEDYEVLAVDKQSKEVTKNPTFQFLHDQKEEIMVVVCMKDFNAANFINEEQFFQKEIRILND